MFFKVAFGRWINEAEPAVGGMTDSLRAYLARESVFSIEADSEEKAREIAERYVGVETHAHEGLDKIRTVEPIREEEARALDPITIYRGYLSDAVALMNKILPGLYADGHEKGLSGPACVKYVQDELERRIAGLP